MKVTSSVITSMSYEAKKRLLTLTYRENKGTYQYFEVPPEEWAAFQAAPSKGTYLNEIFKSKGYRYTRLEQAATSSKKAKRR